MGKNIESRLNRLEEEAERVYSVPSGYFIVSPVLNVVYGDGTWGEAKLGKISDLKALIDKVYGPDAEDEPESE